MTPIQVAGTSISKVWAEAFLGLMSPGTTQRHPALITIRLPTSETDLEDPEIRTLLDVELRRHKKSTTSTVAGTIFPMSMWNPSLENHAEALYARYERAWPGIKKCPANRMGVYFRRLTSYAPKDSSAVPVNQLRFIVDTYLRGNHRKSALQASILDPTRDHTNNRVKGFPCMQQVAFAPMENGEMSIAGFYATQYQFEKAYGNYLGLYGLGCFIAKQLGLRLTQVVCMASVLDLGNSNKSELVRFSRDLEALLKNR